MAKASHYTPDLSIVIPTKDRQSILVESLHKLIHATNNYNVEIIIINDAEQELKQLPSSISISVYKNPKSGVASARNLGANKAQAEILLFLDDDMHVSHQNIQYIIAFHKANHNCFLNLNWEYPPEMMQHIDSMPFGRYLKHFGFTSLKGWNKNNPHWKDYVLFETNGITSQNLSVRRKTFNASRCYNENFPYAGFEDHEYTSRIQKMGFKIYIEPDQMTYHNESDRLNLPNWLARKYRGGITRKIALHYGFTECQLNAGLLKKWMVIVLSPFLYPISQFVSSLCNYRALDFLFYKCINKLLAIAIYGGYFSRKAAKLVKKISE